MLSTIEPNPFLYLRTNSFLYLRTNPFLYLRTNPTSAKDDILRST